MFYNDMGMRDAITDEPSLIYNVAKDIVNKINEGIEIDWKGIISKYSISDVSFIIKELIENKKDDIAISVTNLYNDYKDKAHLSRGVIYRRLDSSGGKIDIDYYIKNINVNPVDIIMELYKTRRLDYVRSSIKYFIKSDFELDWIDILKRLNDIKRTSDQSSINKINIMIEEIDNAILNQI